MIYIYTLGYKIKSLTLLKQINFTKQTRRQCSVITIGYVQFYDYIGTIIYRYCVEGSFVSSVRLRFKVRVSLGLVKVSVGLVMVRVTLGLA